MTLIRPPPLRLAAPPPPSLCIIPSLKPGTEEVASVCGKPTEPGDLCCAEHWRKVTPDTRRDFVAERKRLRKLEIAKASPLMRELIKRVIIEAARR